LAYGLILTTASSLKEARQLAKILIQARAAACVSLSSPVESLYRWKGKVEKSREVMLFIKARTQAFKRIETLIRQNHTYAVPEILLLPIRRGSAAYLKWLRQETRP